MSELEQQKKTLSFEEICPTWSRRIANYNNLSNEDKHEIRGKLTDIDRCFVGEAHKGDGTYSGCLTCSHFCGKLPTHFWNHGDIDWKIFNLEKDVFVKHFNEVHING